MRRHSNHAAKTLPATDSAKIAKAAAPSVAREPTTAGSDTHHTVSLHAAAEEGKLPGVLLEERLTGTAHYARLVLERKIKACLPHLEGCC